MADASASRVIVFGPEAVTGVIGPEPIVTLIDDIEALLVALTEGSRADSVVIWADAVNADDTARLAEAVRACGKRCIEVRAERWDGRTPSPLSAACAGVISGFGANGIQAAVRLLSGL